MKNFRSYAVETARAVSNYSIHSDFLMFLQLPGRLDMQIHQSPRLEKPLLIRYFYSIYIPSLSSSLRNTLPFFNTFSTASMQATLTLLPYNLDALRMSALFHA